MPPRPKKPGVRSGRPNDQWGERAKREGYPARSVYKLEEIDRRTRILRQGQSVLDLGAYPGSWSLYAAKKVGGKGRVLGIDIQPPRGGFPVNVEQRHADVNLVTVADLGEFDVVLSDMAPNTIGYRPADQFHSFELFMAALRVARDVLKPHGSFVGKIFQGAEFPEAQKAMREVFTTVRIIKPDASRQESYETFLVGLDKKA
ncbi:MAG: RlmE family RNA methyltransferase [Sandaracinaceae bacterium]|nr:RlmE family RNA methyltransferase [Sandaracinaceae bacterium]